MFKRKKFIIYSLFLFPSAFVYGNNTCQQVFTKSIEELERSVDYWRAKYLQLNSLAEDISISYYKRQYWRLEAEHAARIHRSYAEQLAKAQK